MNAAPPRRGAHPRLRDILLVVNLVVLFLPLAGIAVLRLYENELVRQTEVELVAQAALVAATYRDLLREARGESGAPPPAEAPPAEAPPAEAPADDEADDAPLDPRPPRLNLVHEEIRPRAPAALPAKAPPEPEAAAAGARLSALLKAAGRITLAGMRVVDVNGTVVATTGGEGGLSLAHREEVARALKGEDVRLLRERISDEPQPPLTSLSRGTPVRVFVASPVYDRGRVVGAVVLSRTPLTSRKAMYQNRVVLLIGSAAMLGVVLTVSLLTAFTISRPIERLVEQSRRLARGDKTALAPLTRPGTAELDELSHALSQMATTLDARATYIQGFAANVSHEFKTPLTSMRGTVELLKDHWEEMDPAERGRFLDMLGADVDRLGRLVKALLELARADTFKPEGARVAVAPVVGGVVERLKARGLDVHLTVETQAEVAVGAEVLDSLLSNLLENCRQHGGPGVKVEVTVRRAASPRADGPGQGPVEVWVRDDGPGISEANAARIFDPFFTTARERGGTGLGLAVSRTLLRGHGGELTLEPSTGGACLKMSLPAA